MMNPALPTESSAPSPVAASAGMDRRTFVGRTARLAAAAAVAAPFVSRARVIGANDRIGVGFIGVGGRGGNHLNVVSELIKSGENLQIVAVCDAYKPRLDAAAKAGDAKPCMRHTELLADPAVDVVCVASPDRLHVPLSMDAMRAGKDVYCEKPLGHWSQFRPCVEMADLAAKLGRVVQVGNQGNSSPAWAKVRDLVQGGAIGRLQHVMAGYYRDGDWGERMTIPDRGAKPGPNLDWEGFLGDAPKVDFTVERFFSWRRYLDYAGGPCTDLFPHVLTPFVSALGLGCPDLAVASGGIFKYTAYDREVPDTFNMALDYPEGASAVLVCTLANAYSTEPAIRGDEGTLTLQNAGGWEGGFDSITVIPRKGGRRVVPGLRTEATPLHWKNFLECVRTRAKPVSDLEFALKVQAAMSMSMLAFLNKKVARFDAAKREIVL
jgi:predicted dehydrogenase